MHSQLMVYGLKKSNKVIIMYTIIMDKYMKTRVGLKPEEYSKEERKYDELNQKTEMGAK